MEAKNIVVIGSSGHASVIVDTIRAANDYSILGYIDDFAPALHIKYGGYKVLGNMLELNRLIDQGLVAYAVIAIGDNAQREFVYEKLGGENAQLKFPNIIHPDVLMPEKYTLGIGSVIMKSVSINPNVKIGDFCILNTASVIEHDCVIENFASIAPGVCLGGNVQIGRSAIISIGSTLIHKIKIGANALVAAGAVVVRNVEDNAVVMGLPAKFIRFRRKGEKYL